MIRKAYQPTRITIFRKKGCLPRGKNLSAKRERAGKEKPEMWITFRISIKDLNKPCKRDSEKEGRI